MSYIKKERKRSRRLFLEVIVGAVDLVIAVVGSPSSSTMTLRGLASFDTQALGSSCPRALGSCSFAVVRL